VFIRVQVQGEDGALLYDVEGVERLREHVSGRHLHPADRRPVQGEAFVELPVDEAGPFAATEIVGPLEALLDGGRCPLCAAARMSLEARWRGRPTTTGPSFVLISVRGRRGCVWIWGQ
jgi:hypothetical protein